MESLVVEEHVEGRGVGLLPRVVGLVLHAAIGLLLETRIGLRSTQAGDKVCPGHKPEKFIEVSKGRKRKKGSENITWLDIYGTFPCRWP